MTAASEQQPAASVATPAVPPRLFRNVWLPAAATCAALYLTTMAPGVLWGDSGDTQYRVLTERLWGINQIARAHATYFAVAVAGCRAFGLEPAFAGNLVAALAGAVTVANFACLVALFVRRRSALISGTCLLMLSHTLWQLSTGAEVVTFSTMCLSFELLALRLFVRTGRLPWLALTALGNSLGWSTHNMALLTWPAYGVCAFRGWRRIPRPRGRSLGVAAAAWAVGFVPLAVMIGREYGQVGDAGTVLRSLLVGFYGDQVFNVAVGPASFARLAAFAGLNFPTPLILLAVWGWWSLRSGGGRGTWWFLTVSTAVFVAFGGRYNVPDQYTFMVHAYVFLVLFAAIGIDHWLDRHPSRAMHAATVALALAGPVVYALAPPLISRYAPDALPRPGREIPYRPSISWFLTPWRTAYDGAERYAREVLDALPPDAVLLIDSTARQPLDYLQLHERLRPDVSIPRGIQRHKADRPPEITPQEAAALIARGRLFCATTVPAYLPPWLAEGGFRFEQVGHVYRVLFPDDGSTPPQPGGGG